MVQFAPQAAARQNPLIRAQQLAAVLEQPDIPRAIPSKSVGEAAVRGISTGMDGFFAGRKASAEQDAIAMQQAEANAQRMQQANALADMLYEPGDGGAPDPRREQLIGLITSGAVDPGSFNDAVVSKAGFGPAPEAPTVHEIFDPATGKKSYMQYVNGQWQPLGGTESELLSSEEVAQKKEIAASGASNITVGGGKFGTIPPGFELIEGPEGASMRPIPGSPADLEMQAGAAQEAAREAGKQVKADVVAEDIDRALGMISEAPETTTGIGGTLLKGVPGTWAADVGALIDTVKANVGFGQLQAMREASPTGGALGAVSERENALLQSVLGSLEQSQSPEQLAYNLKRLKNTYLDIIHGEGNGPARVELSPAETGVPKPGDVMDGYKFKGGDPANPENWEQQ